MGENIVRQAMRWRRDTAFALGVVALCVLTALALSAGGAAMTGSQAISRTSAPSPTTTPRATSTATGASGAAHVVSASTRNYQLDQANAGLMQPAVDAQGNVWVGEMNLNALARLDTHTGLVSTWTPPNGHYNIMAAVTDSAGTVWFTEQAASYIGRFDPASQQFQVYPLAGPNGHGAAPQDLTFDRNGMLWFTEVTGGAVGRLDPASGAIRTYPVPAPSATTPSYPYSLAVTPDGQVWFGDLTGGVLGQVDPVTGAVRLVRLPDPRAQIYSMAADAQGRIWFTELEQGKLGMLDTHTGTVTELAVPQTLGTPAGLYDVVVAPTGDVWFACASANALVQYSPRTGQFTFHVLSVPASVPFGLAFDTAGSLWFTADGTPANYIGVLRP
jgi:virginiamycin B lyase